MKNPTNKPSCGPLFKQVWELARKDETSEIAQFSWGHLCASAEKVYLGACVAAMFRPGIMSQDSFVKRLQQVAGIYGLSFLIRGSHHNTEYWLFRLDNHRLIDLIDQVAENSPAHHFIRGILCGVPASEIDLEFHLRQGARTENP